MLVTSCVSSEQKVKWLKQWNQPLVTKEATKFPKQGFSNVVCAKWHQKTTFQFQVGSTPYSNRQIRFVLGNFQCRTQVCRNFHSISNHVFLCFQELLQKSSMYQKLLPPFLANSILFPIVGGDSYSKSKSYLFIAWCSLNQTLNPLCSPYYLSLASLSHFNHERLPSLIISRIGNYLFGEHVFLGSFD